MIPDSDIDIKWLESTAAANPAAECVGEDGEPNGCYTTGPVRLMFPHLFSPRPADKYNDHESFQCMVVWPATRELSVLGAAVKALMLSNFKTTQGINSPFRDQGDKAQTYQGMAEGVPFANLRSQFQPHVVDVNMNRITDEKRVYSGVWAIVATSLYAYDQRGNRGVSLSLDNVMIIADDRPINLEGGAAPEQSFAGVKVNAPIPDPSSGFGGAGKGQDDTFGGLV